MPTVLIWSPNNNYEFGHVALRTDKYHISLWPFKGKRFRFSGASITGRLHFHEHLDWVEEGSSENPRGPTARHEIVNVTNEAINRVYEEFLFYNGIDPEEVTLAAAKKKLFHLCHRRLPLTRYSLVGDVIVDKTVERSNVNLLFFIKSCLTYHWSNYGICRHCFGLITTNQSITCPFYHEAQSCVSFCFNLIEMADPRPLVCLVEGRDSTSGIVSWSRFWRFFLLVGDGICREVTVPNFERHVVQSYWLKGCERLGYLPEHFQNSPIHYLMVSENLINKVVMVTPTIFFLAWLRNFFHFSYLGLFVITGPTHFLHIVLLYKGIKLFPSVRLPKLVAFLCGVPSIIALLHHHNHFSHLTGKDALRLTMGGTVKLFAKFVPKIFDFCVFFFSVKSCEFISHIPLAML